MDRYFYCYSYPLKEFLVNNGLKFITAAVNQATNKRYWLFEGTDKLNKLLTEWRLNKQLSFFYFRNVILEEILWIKDVHKKSLLGEQIL